MHIGSNQRNGNKAGSCTVSMMGDVWKQHAQNVQRNEVPALTRAPETGGGREEKKRSW